MSSSAFNVAGAFNGFDLNAAADDGGYSVGFGHSNAPDAGNGDNVVAPSDGATDTATTLLEKVKPYEVPVGIALVLLLIAAAVRAASKKP